MPKKLISQQAVITAAEQLVRAKRTPTVAAIKTLLNSSSEPTIHKYLSQWKQQCFNQMVSTGIEPSSNASTLVESNELARSLQLELAQQIKQNEHYAQELINAEKTNIALKETIHQLQSTNQQLQLELKEVKAIKTTLAQVNLEIQTRLDANNHDLINKQQLLIEELRTELKELNVKSMLALQQTSSAGHELLMQEKLTSINLQEKINTLGKQLVELQQQLQTTNNKLAAKQQPLLRQIEWQQQIIQNHLGFDKLRQIEEEELRLKFNAQVQVAYGK